MPSKNVVFHSPAAAAPALCDKADCIALRWELKTSPYSYSLVFGCQLSVTGVEVEILHEAARPREVSRRDTSDR